MRTRAQNSDPESVHAPSQSGYQALATVFPSLKQPLTPSVSLRASCRSRGSARETLASFLALAHALPLEGPWAPAGLSFRSRVGWLLGN